MFFFFTFDKAFLGLIFFLICKFVRGFLFFGFPNFHFDLTDLFDFM